ncbi:hypothetical protein [Mariniblastus fucicola]|uniref:Lipoprotein n=1 Tax=Mariniblastus fucicola TaxID=980251 RepID=A0A5B9PGV4_9BACT|nr:hypothetical protein [Mariniblastus fucicola]QEG24490.1 hypothetical protein MFFC18_44100 [Mariniblastus fucicola]
MKSNQICRFLCLALALAVFSSIGCVPPSSKDDVAKKDKPKPIIGQTTSEISEWDPDAGQTIRVDGEDVNIVNRNLKALSGASNTIAKMKVQQSLELFRATEGRYPKTFEEFMDKVFKVYVVDLPMPVTSCEYQYDVENHELLVVEKKKAE